MFGTQTPSAASVYMLKLSPLVIKDSAPAVAGNHKQMKCVQHILFTLCIMDVDSAKERKLKISYAKRQPFYFGHGA